MSDQLTIDFCDRRENNFQNQSILDSNKDHINGQCKKLLELFESGQRLTVRDLLIYHNIGDPRRRIKDLRDAKFEIKDELISGRFKVYFMSK